MEGNTISLKEVLRQMDGEKPFNMEVVACDKKRGTGGKIIKFTAVTLNRKARGVAGVTGDLKIKDGAPKAPGHYENSTRNVYDGKRPRGERIVKVHLRLIVTFNGLRVI